MHEVLVPDRPKPTPRAMAEVRRVARFAVAEEVASSIRHDLRNKLASVRNATHYLETKLSPSAEFHDDPRCARFFQLVVSELEKADAILMEYLDFSHGFERHVERVKLGPWLEAFAAEAPSVRLELGDDVRAAMVSLDPTEVELALTCLVENELGPSVICVRAEAACVRISVRGASDIAWPPMHGRLRSQREGHLGVGLRIVKRTVERYGGTVAVEGDAVVLTLPLAAPGPRDLPRTSSSQPAGESE